MLKKMTLFNLIGKKYDGTRKADPHIVKAILKYLNLPKGGIVVDIGAGTGNYSEVLAENQYKVIAIEPSEVMRKQGKQHPRIFWLEGFAEDLPLKDNFADGIICIATVHHFSDIRKAFKEMYRILKPGGSAVIVGADHKVRKNLWLDDYFNPLESTLYPTAKDVAKGLEEEFKTAAQIKFFLVPAEVQDCFFISGWRRPWFYLDDTFCNNISPLAKAPKAKLKAFQDKLKKDIFSGEWEKRYGKILELESFDGGYYFVVVRKPI